MNPYQANINKSFMARPISAAGGGGGGGGERKSNASKVMYSVDDIDNIVVNLKSGEQIGYRSHGILNLRRILLDGYDTDFSQPSQPSPIPPPSVSSSSSSSSLLIPKNTGSKYQQQLGTTYEVSKLTLKEQVALMEQQHRFDS